MPRLAHAHALQHKQPQSPHICAACGIRRRIGTSAQLTLWLELGLVAIFQVRDRVNIHCCCLLDNRSQPSLTGVVDWHEAVHRRDARLLANSVKLHEVAARNSSLSCASSRGRPSAGWNAARHMRRFSWRQKIGGQSDEFVGPGPDSC